jgi:hypothetical protein
MEKKAVVLVMTLLSGTAVYQLLSSSAPSSSQRSVEPEPVASTVAVVECLDCMEAVPDSCESETYECLDLKDCSDWLSCTEDCVKTQGDQSCYDDCDVSHSDTHSECSSMKSCMCDVCVGQCVDMCMADG